MCGIIDIQAPLEAKDVLLKDLAGLEYRGYDSAGIAYFNQDSQIRSIKKVGKVAAPRECKINLRDIPLRNRPYPLGHHGGERTPMPIPTRCGQVTLIHNGIIEKLPPANAGIWIEGRLVPQTDSEVAAAVLILLTGDASRIR